MTQENRQDATLAASNKQEAMTHEGPLTPDEVIKLRTDQLLARAQRPAPEPPPEPEEPEATEEEEPEATEDESDVEEGESEQEDSDVLSKLNLDEMSEGELAELGKAVKSKVPKRFGELTKRAKAAEEELQRLRSKLNEKTEENPLEKKAPIENNPFKDVDTIDGLREKNEQFARIIEWADELLDENEHASFDDYITDDPNRDGKQLTKREVKAYLKNARLSREKFLPARLVEIQQVEQGKQIQAALQEKAKVELPWYGNQDEATQREYELVVNDPRIKLIRDRVPEVAPQLDFLLAHAVNSMSQAMNKTKAPAKKSVTLTPPPNPSEASARSPDRDKDRFSKDLKELSSRLENSNSYDDFAALRTQQRLRKNR